MNANHLLNKSDLELINDIEISNLVTARSEQCKIILQQRMLDKLIVSMNMNSESSGKLADKLNKLTRAIFWATVSGIGITVIIFLYQIFHQTH